MSLRRTLLVAGEEIREAFGRPLFWVWVVLILTLSWGLSTGHVRISSGDSAVGGTKAWFTSEFSVAGYFSIVSLLMYSFFVAILAGMSVIRDDEQKISELLHSTPLRPFEYILGKLGATGVLILIVLLINVAALIVCNHVLPNDRADEIRGPFSLMNYLRPMFLLGLPPLLLVGGVSFALGTISRRPILIFFLPVALILFCGFFLWDWKPGWLDPRVDRILILLDPAARRWMDQVWLAVDRGVDFYNKAPVGLDATFLWNRMLCLLGTVFAVVVAGRHFERGLRGAAGTSSVKSRKSRKSPEGLEPSDSSAGVAHARPVPALGALAAERPSRSFLTSMRPPGVLRGMASVARFELAELWSTPGLYLFVPLILLQILGDALTAVGAFDTPLLVTPGTLAVQAQNTVSFLACMLLLFYTVESLRREENTGLAPIYHATSAHTFSMLFGKAIANSVVAFVIVLATALAGVIAMLVQNRVPIHLGPFLLVWGVLLAPTFLVWTGFVSMVYALTRNRYTTYALGLLAMTATFILQFTGRMNWVGNWNLWSVLRWSDLGTLVLDRAPLLWNRLEVLGLALFFFAVTVRAYPRREADPTRVVHRLRAASMWRGVLALLPYAAIPIVAMIVLGVQVRTGFQGKVVEKKDKDYWVQNLATWKGAPQPGIRRFDIDLKLDPAKHWFRTEGSFVLWNWKEKPLAQFALTGGRHWEKIEWTMNDSTFTPEDRTRLFVFKPDSALAPGDSVEVGFHFEGRWPRGATRNGGGLSEFILPSGVVLTSFGPSFVPVVGYDESVGVTDKNRYEPRVYPDDYWKETLPPAFGGQTPARGRVSIHGPSEFAYHSVGVCVRDEVSGSERTTVWETDAPVRFFNVVAGKWNVRRGEGTALYYYPGHVYNIEAMGQALDGARRYFSEWFRPFPWKELKVSEFPGLESYAQGFPTNITFSESIGFLTKDDKKTQVAFFVTAHEAAHQWWGNMLTPGEGPGGNILSEGMAHFSTILLTEEVQGLQSRIEFCRRLEDRYGDRRQSDSERPLVKIDGSKPGDTTVTYDKGGWVFYMLSQLMGREATLAGLQEFMRRFADGPDYPLIEDLIFTLREFAPDLVAYDAFVHQWFFEVKVPQYQILDPKRVVQGSSWQVAGKVTNRGTGRAKIEIAAAVGERFSTKEGEEGKQVDAYRDVRSSLTLDSGETADFSVTCDFEPDRVLVDPDALVLQLQRKQALVRF